MFTEALCSQRRAIFIPFRITVSAGVPTLAEGSTMLSITDGAAGVYAMTFGGTRSLGAAKRAPVVVATCETATGVDLIATVVSSSVSGFTIEVSDDAGTLTEATIVHGLAIWFDSADEQ